MGTTLHPHDALTDLERFGAAALATAGVGVVAVAANAAGVGLPCPLLATTGVPCPACGVTRLADAVVHGRLVEAATTDPAGLVFLAVIATLAAAYVATRIRGVRPEPSLRPAPGILVTLLVVHWLTTLTFGGYVDA